MLRRNFFATLLAPLVARFAPKPNPVRQLVEAMRAMPPVWTEHELKYSCAVGTGYWKQTMDWLDSCPQLDDFEDIDA